MAATGVVEDRFPSVNTPPTHGCPLIVLYCFEYRLHLASLPRTLHNTLTIYGGSGGESIISLFRAALSNYWLNSLHFHPRIPFSIKNISLFKPCSDQRSSDWTLIEIRAIFLMIFEVNLCPKGCPRRTMNRGDRRDLLIIRSYLRVPRLTTTTIIKGALRPSHAELTLTSCRPFGTCQQDMNASDMNIILINNTAGSPLIRTKYLTFLID